MNGKYEEQLITAFMIMSMATLAVMYIQKMKVGIQ